MRFPAGLRQAAFKILPFILVGLPVLLVLLLAFSQILVSKQQAPIRAVAPAEANLPADIAGFLHQVGDAYGSAGFADLPRHLASDFLYQGMNKDAFIEHLKQEQKHLGRLKIVPISHEVNGEAVRVVAYAVSPRGVLAPSMQLLPLNAGATLVKESGAWKLRGNQRRDELALYRKLSGLTADFTPFDMDVYRRLVPPGFTVPNQPYVRIAVTNWLDMEPPQTPCRLATLSILVQKNEENIWYIVSMPETDWLAVEGGKVFGFPKLLADIDIERSFSNRWNVAIGERGKEMVNVTFEPDGGAKVGDVRQVDSWLLIDKDKQQFRAWMTPLGNPSLFDQKFGWMTVNTIASPWKELVAPGSRAAATAVDVTMGMKLNLVALPSQGGAHGGS